MLIGARLSWEIRKRGIIFLLKTIFQIDWVAAGRVYHRPCCQSQCYPGNDGKRKGPAAAGGSVHIPAALHETRLLSTSCQRWAMLGQATETHILGDDTFRVTASWVLTPAFLSALLSNGRSYSNGPNFLSFLVLHSHFKNEQTEAQRGCFLLSVRVKQDWCALASSPPPTPLDISTPPLSNLKLGGQRCMLQGGTEESIPKSKNIQYLIFKDLKMSNKDSFFNLLNKS